MTFILSHTHWDREWFATAEYTRKWLPKLFENLLKLVAKDNSFEYVLDGQTLIMEDLREENPELYEKALNFIRSGNLKIGPVYAQIDWRMSIPQAIWKNFELGEKDCKSQGACMKVGWFMDNFGQISQLPQIMKKFGVNFSIVWRGIREIFPFFVWRSPDGSEVEAIGLIGGYRTLYNLSDTEGIAKKRFDHEVRKLERFGKPVVLMDGYDLDLHPENPKNFLNGRVFSTSIEKLLRVVKKLRKPVVIGELISGKIASVFPGTLSTRTYLKLGSDFIGKLLTTLEFLASGIGENLKTDVLWREYLKTLIHDNICGVGIDQVHEKMEKSYEMLYKDVKDRISEVLRKYPLDGNFIFTPSSYSGYFPKGDEILEVKSDGLGLWKYKSYRYVPSDPSNFQPFEIVLEKDEGDAYSSDCKKERFTIITKLTGSYKSPKSVRYAFERIVKSDKVEIKLEEIYDIFEDMVWLQSRIIPRGCCYRLYYSFEGSGKIYAGMPFDIVQRPCTDRDLYPREETLGGILLAAREVGRIEEFPMQDFVIATRENESIAIITKGLRSYLCKDGKLMIPLVRSVEWITKKVSSRSGNAGPSMYVPGARSERWINIDLVVMRGKIAPFSEEFLSRVRFLSWPKILVSAKGARRGNILLSRDGAILPGMGISGKVIMKNLPVRKVEKGKSEIYLLLENLPYGPDKKIPDVRVIEKLEDLAKRSRKDAEKARESAMRSVGIDRIRYEHRYWAMLRTSLEMKLSALLNRERLGEKVKDEIEKLTWKLNEVRGKKRTYDYILEFWKAETWK